MTNPFLDTAPTVRSLNRARIVALPGVEVDEGILGKSGFELLSNLSLQRHIAALAGSLELDADDPDLPRRFDRCFTSPEVRDDALEIAQSYGRKLSYLLLMLRRGDAENRAARPEWSDAHWAFWRSVRHLYLGGGIVAGNLGRYAVEVTRHLLKEHGVDDLMIDISPHAAYLPLLGLARAAPPDVRWMLLVDFGQTSIKRGIARYRSGRLVELQVLATMPSVCGDIQFEPTLEEVRQRWRRMLEVIEGSWLELPPFAHADRDATALGVSLACHLSQGHPFGDRSCYGSLQLLCDNLEGFMKDEVAILLKRALPFVLMHDASAAATAYAGAKDAVVVTLGTAIGLGFPPPRGDYYRPLHPKLLETRR
jgi:hypothetical protein